MHKHNKQKTSIKVIEVSLLIPVTTFHTSDLNTPGKRDDQIGFQKKKTRTNYMLTTWNILVLIETYQGKVIP